MSATGNPTTSTCRFSTRVSLRWPPEPAHETTDTIVMSVQDWFLDLRIDKETGEIDWAIAGQRLVESEEPRTSSSSPTHQSLIPSHELLTHILG